MRQCVSAALHGGVNAFVHTVHFAVPVLTSGLTHPEYTRSDCWSGGIIFSWVPVCASLFRSSGGFVLKSILKWNVYFSPIVSISILFGETEF